MNIFSQITNMISSNLNIMFLESVFDFIIASIFRISCYILNLVKLILNLIFDLAGTDFFSAEAIGDIGKRLYVLLGIFMLIKITISCVTYLINPDKSDDKENGFGSIIKRTAISLLLLLAVPSVFNFAKQAQIAIVDTLPKIILGNAGNVDIDDVGERIAYSTMLAFVDYTEGCNDGSIAGRPDANGQIVDYQNGAGNIKVYSMDSLINNASEIISATCGSKKRYEVLWYLSPLVAGYLVFMLVSMAFYVGIRTIKFGFLQLIAPIPIASYVDPKSSKKSFDSWVHNCVSVYIDLFIRLGVIYLMIYLFEIVLGSITSSVVVYGETIGGPRVAFIKLFIIFSIILFAKEAPKFISDVLGIKAEGSIKEMFARGAGLAGAGLAGTTAGISNFRNGMRGQGAFPKKVLKSGLSSFAGSASAIKRGARTAFNAKDVKSGFKDSFNKGYTGSMQARVDRTVDQLSGDPSYFDRMRVKRDDFMYIKTSNSLAEGRIKACDDINADVGSLKGKLWSRLEKVNNLAMNVKTLEDGSLSPKGGAYDYARALYDNSDEIRKSGNLGLIKELEKFDFGYDSEGKLNIKLKAGEKIRFSNINAIRDTANNEKIMGLAASFEEKGAIFQKAQKELFIAAMNGEVHDIYDNYDNDVNVVTVTKDGKIVQNEKAHKEVKTIIENANRHFAQYEADFDAYPPGFEKIPLVDENGRRLTGKEAYMKAFMIDFNALDDALLQVKNDAKHDLAMSKETAAREANKRREANKDKK